MTKFGLEFIELFLEVVAGLAPELPGLDFCGGRLESRQYKPASVRGVDVTILEDQASVVGRNLWYSRLAVVEVSSQFSEGAAKNSNKSSPYLVRMLAL